MKMNSVPITQEANQNKDNKQKDELYRMEKVLCKASILKFHNLPINNYNYQPLQGA